VDNDPHRQRFSIDQGVDLAPLHLLAGVATHLNVFAAPFPPTSPIGYRRLRWHLPQINRVVDPRHASRMEHIEDALAALGLRLVVDVTRAAA